MDLTTIGIAQIKGHSTYEMPEITQIHHSNTWLPSVHPSSQASPAKLSGAGNGCRKTIIVYPFKKGCCQYAPFPLDVFPGENVAGGRIPVVAAAPLYSCSVYCLLFASLATDPAMTQLLDQTILTDHANSSDDIIVTGARQEQRSTIDVKRRATVIADGIVDDEIGALPDNSVADTLESVADTLERIPGVSAGRFKGNANDPTVRGLGPTLNFMTINGRQASAAGIDRSVSFQQFPSELISGVMVYKTQQADFLEGGIGGVIDLRTARPLDAKGSRLTGEVLGSYFPKDHDIRGRNGLGYRADLTYLDQFHTGLGEIGISIGLRRQDTVLSCSARMP